MDPDNNRKSSRNPSIDDLLKTDSNPSFLERVKKLKRDEYLQGFAKSQYITQTPTPTYSPTPSPTPTNTITIYPTPPVTPTPSTTGIEDSDMFDEAMENCISLSAQFLDGITTNDFQLTERAFTCIEQTGEFVAASTTSSGSLSSINKASICPVIQIESLSTTNLVFVEFLKGQKEKSVACAYHKCEFFLVGGGGGGGVVFPTNPIEEASYCLTTTWEAILVGGSVFPTGKIPSVENTNTCVELETEFLSAEAINFEDYVGDALKHTWSMCAEVSSQFLLAPAITLDIVVNSSTVCIEPQCSLFVAPAVEGELINEDTNVCIFTYMELLTTDEAGTSFTTLTSLDKAECCVTMDVEVRESGSANFGTSFVFYAPVTEDNLNNTGDYVSFAGTNAIFRNYDSATSSYEFESFSDFINRRRLNPTTSLPDRIIEYTHDLCELKDLFQFSLNFPQGAGQTADEIGAFIAYPAITNSVQTIIDSDTTVYPVIPQTPITTQISITGGAPAALMYGGTLYKLQRLSLQVPNLSPALNVKVNTCL